MYSKYKLVPSISVISGKMILCFITSLKARAPLTQRFKFARTMNDITSGAD